MNPEQIRQYAAAAGSVSRANQVAARSAVPGGANGFASNRLLFRSVFIPPLPRLPVRQGFGAHFAGPEDELITRAGFPTTVAPSGTERMTTAPIPIRLSDPISTPGRIDAPRPMKDPSPIRKLPPVNRHLSMRRQRNSGGSRHLAVAFQKKRSQYITVGQFDATTRKRCP